MGGVKLSMVTPGSPATLLVERYVPWLYGAVVAWLVLLLSLRAVGRRRRGEPILRPSFLDAVFVETWASGGRSLVWVRSCVWVVVTPRAIHVGLHFPFNLALPRSWAPWFPQDLHIPISNVIGTENRHEFFEGGSLEVRFRDERGRPGAVRLRLQREDAFLRHIYEARGYET